VILCEVLFHGMCVLSEIEKVFYTRYASFSAVFGDANFIWNKLDGVISTQVAYPVGNEQHI